MKIFLHLLPVTPARFYKNEGFKCESYHAFDLLGHGENP